MRHLDLFSGIGGFALAARWVGWETVGFCEIDPYCQKVLRKHWPDVPIIQNIRTFDDYEQFRDVSIVTGGYPCQPFSSAARGRNTATDLWPEFRRVVQGLRPDWVVIENVISRSTTHLEQAGLALESDEYATWFFDVGVEINGHTRRRGYVVAHSYGESESGGAIDEEMASLPEITRYGRTDPDPMGMDDGLPPRMDRLRGLGNAIVPQVAERIFRAINEIA